MFSSAGVPKDLALLGPASTSFSQLAENAQVALQAAWTSHTETLQSDLEKVKVEAEQKIAELSSSNNDLSSKLAVYTEETERGQTALQMYREQVSCLHLSFITARDHFILSGC